jgi:hypothetical protein
VNFSLKEEKNQSGKRNLSPLGFTARGFLRTRNDRKSTAVGRQNDRVARTFGLRRRLSFGRPFPSAVSSFYARAISFPFGFFCSSLSWFKSLTTISLSPSRLLHSHYIKNARAIIARPSVAQWSYRSNKEEFVCVKYTSFVFSSVNVEETFARFAGKRQEAERERTLRFCKIYLSKASRAESVLSIILSNFFLSLVLMCVGYASSQKNFFSFSLLCAAARRSSNIYADFPPLLISNNHTTCSPR